MKKEEWIEKYGIESYNRKLLYTREYRKQNQEKIKKQSNDYYQKNKEYKKEKRKEYYHTHQDKELAYQREYYKANRIQKIEYMKVYNQKEEVKQRYREYRKNNRKRINARIQERRRIDENFRKKEQKQNRKSDLKRREKKKQYYLSHQKEFLAKDIEWRKSNREKTRKNSAEHRNKGFIPLTFPLEMEFDWHHIDKDLPYVIAIPRDIHRSVGGNSVDNHFSTINGKWLIWAAKHPEAKLK